MSGSAHGFTLIELMIVISIIALLSLVGYANYRDFSASQVPIKAAGQVQSILRQAQSNATTSTLCKDKGSTSWSVVFTNSSRIELRCNPDNFLQKEFELENAEVAITGDNCPITIIPATITFQTGTGTQSVSTDDPLLSESCKNSAKKTFSVVSKKNPNASAAPFNFSRGGAINVN